jgi:hypothetical protein
MPVLCRRTSLAHFRNPSLPSAHLLDAARQSLSTRGARDWPRGHKAVNFYQAGIEQHELEQGRYDIIWLQWAALYLTDGELGKPAMQYD